MGGEGGREGTPYYLENTIAAQQFFWRTYDQAEVDLVEQRAGKLYGYEIKYSSSKNAKPPKAWTRAYPDAQWSIVNRDNFVEFLLHAS